MWQAIGALGSIGSSILGNRAARRAQQAQAEAARQAMGYMQTASQGFDPYAQAGESNLNRLNALMGGDYSGFTNSPDFRAAQDIGLRQLDRSAAARGSLYSGGADADRIALGQQLASQYLSNYRNALSGLAGMGMQARGQQANLAGNMANIAIGAGQARASAYQQQGQNMQNMIGNLTSFGVDWLRGRGG